MTKTHISNSLSTYFKVFAETLSKPQQSHFASWNLGILHGNALGSEISKLFSNSHETSLTRFLSQSSWDHHELNQMRISYASNILTQKYQKYVSLIIDDTVSEKFGKQLPGIGYHYSHAENGVVWGQSMVTSQMVVGDVDIPLFADLYHKNSGESKIELAKKQISQFSAIHIPQGITPVVLIDSWYSGKDIINRCLESGFPLVTMLKSNRKVKINGLKNRIRISKIADTLRKDFLKIVTVEGTRYRYAQFTGSLWGTNGHTGKILMVQQFLKSKKKWSNFIFLYSTQASMDPWTLLWLYRKRWKIETFYKFGKEKLGLDRSRNLKEEALLRFVLLLFSVYTYLSISRCKESFYYLAKISYYKCQKHIIAECQTQLISWVFHKTLNGSSLQQILLQLNLVEKTA